jgi:DNA-directed RNA polymerase specialized sigma24 family protein
MKMKSKAAEAAPQLRELMKENDQRLYDFCYYMLYGGIGIEDQIVSIFRSLRRTMGRLSMRDDGKNTMELRLRLFQTVWQLIQVALEGMQYEWPVGRDTRQLKGLDEDILREWQSNGRDASRLEEAVLERLSRIEPDLRATIILRDILGMDDEDAVRILGVRWGVYRHRLHRGRLELKDGLKAHSYSSEAKGIPLPLRTSPSVP